MQGQPGPAEDAADGRLHVVAAVIRRADGHVLISHRPAHVDQGNLWEFPGGKRHAGESRRAALERELGEELGITVEHALPLLQVPHDYPTRRVQLDVFVVDRFRGDAHGREGQAVRWVAPSALAAYRFPAANLPILTAARLPRTLLITPDPGSDATNLIPALERCLVRGARLVQLRAPSLGDLAYRALAREALACCRTHDARLILNADPELALALGADGVHLNTRRLYAAGTRPVPRDCLLSVACHDAQSLAQAGRIGADVALVSPVLRTASHPDAEPLGWPALAALIAPTGLPVYALGGLAPAMLAEALRAGCVGIAGIAGFWSGAGALDDARLTADLEVDAL